jgi:hypothetical protein
VTETRKTVTIVFADVTGTTTLGEQTDPEVMRRIMERYFEEMRAILEKHGGTVEKFIGGAVMAVFGVPTAHEDDAVRAVRAAAEMRDRLAVLNEEVERERGITIAVRTGVNRGEVIAGDPVGRTGIRDRRRRQRRRPARAGGSTRRDPPRAGPLGLAFVLAKRGELEEAEAPTRESEGARSRGRLTTQVAWRAARAMVIAQKGSFEDAQALARAAIELADRLSTRS